MNYILLFLTFVALNHVVFCRTGDTCGCPDKCFCSKTLESVNCEGKEFQDFPPCLPTQVKKLYMRNNRLVTINSSQIGTLPHLEELFLQNNNIQHLQTTAFQGKYLPRVTQLRLENNKILRIDHSSFEKMASLQKLFLSNNKIISFHKTAFTGANISLETLNLDGNFFTAIPAFKNLNSITSLYMEANNIINASFPEEYRSMKRLRDIGLSNNKIKILRNDSFAALSLSDVRKLEISRNKIDTIEIETFAPLKSIQSLYLGWNPLTSRDLEGALLGLQGKPLVSLNIVNLTLGGFLPNSTFALLRNTSLTYLIMKHNNIGTIPSRAFSELQGLLTIDISGSRVRNISDSAFDGLNQLTTLFLSDCVLTDVPRNLPSTLTSLCLNGNRITTLNDDVFVNLVSLRRLYIGGNLIVTLHQKAFNGLTNLQILHLVDNNIGTLPGAIFDSLVRLTSLELNKNNIKFIPNTEPHVLEPLTALTYLTLADNGLASFPLSLFNKLTSLRTLKLGNNLMGGPLEVDTQAELFANLGRLEILGLDNNYITSINPKAFESLLSLKQLHMRQNRISGWNVNLFSTTNKLEMVDLSRNYIALVNTSSLKYFGDNMKLNLTANPFACTCDLRWFRDWLNSTKVDVIDVEKYRCNSPESWSGRKLLSFDRTKIKCLWFSIYVVIVCSVGAALLILILVIICYRKRWFIRLRMYRLRRRCCHSSSKMGGTDYEIIKQFDAYISSSDADYDWVINNLLPDVDNGENLNEKKPFGGKFKLFFDGINGVGGTPSIKSIVENTEQSRKAIIILSNKYTKSAMCQFELSYLITCKHEGTISDLLIVKLSDVTSRDIPKCLRGQIEKTNFIEWETGQDAIATFKESINHFLEKN